MQKRGLKRLGLATTLMLILVLAQHGYAFADTTSSSHYKVSDTQFNSGAGQGCSTNYCAATSAGDTTVGRSSSDNYAVQFGSNPNNVPLLEVILLGDANQNLGILDADHTATAANVLKIRDYSGRGYSVQVVGDPPSQGTHEITNLTSPSTSHPGAEQFGINLVANTDPKVGADPVQNPAGNVLSGEPTDDYDMANLFKYINGDIIANSQGSTSQTDYTISMILNVSNTTPLGHYGGIFSVIVVPGY